MTRVESLTRVTLSLVMSVFYSRFNAQPHIFAGMNRCVIALSVFSSDILIWNQWLTRKISEGGTKFCHNRALGEVPKARTFSGVRGLTPKKFSKITPKNTHFCALWKQVLL